MTDVRGIFTEAEYEALAMAYLDGCRGDTLPPKEDLIAFIRWAEEMRVCGMLIGNVLCGAMVVGPSRDADPTNYVFASRGVWVDGPSDPQ